MKNKALFFLVLALAFSGLGMGRNPNQYDQEARLEKKNQPTAAEPSEGISPAKNFAKGLKEVSVDNVKDTLSDTAHGTASEKPVVGTLDGAQKAGDKVVDNTIKGVKKIASLGFSQDDSYEIDEAEKGSGDAAKIKLFQF